MSALPGWVWDTVIALQEHSDEHPKYFAQYAARGDQFVPAATCGCEPLKQVPEDIRAKAEAIAEDRRRRGDES